MNIHLVYIGAECWPQKNGSVKLLHAYLPVRTWPERPVLDGFTRYWAKPLHPGRPGYVIACEADEKNDRFSISNVTYAGQWLVDSDVAAWQTSSDAALAQSALLRQRSKALSHNALQRSLTPIRDAYQAASFNKRRHILALVLEYITR